MSQFTTPAVAIGGSGPDAIAIGWLLMGRLEPVHRDAALHARDQMLARLSAAFPGYAWNMPMVERRDAIHAILEQPSALLEAGALECEARGWDFVLVITGADLVSYYQSITLAASSRGLGAAALSMARIDPLTERCFTTAEDRPDTRGQTMSARLATLALHAFGHLNGLGHDDDPASIMHDCRTLVAVDDARDYSGRARARLAGALPRVAGLRLEERSGRGRLRFLARAAWRLRGDIASAVRRAAPWQLPLRLGRLTTAALVAMATLMISSDYWRVALAQPASVIVALAVVAITGATWHVLKHQRLLLTTVGSHLTRQLLVARLSAILGVGIGMATTYALMFTIAMALYQMVFSPAFVARWIGMRATEVSMADYLCVAGFLSTIAVVVGALGASLEDQDHVRHVTFVDDET